MYITRRHLLAGAAVALVPGAVRGRLSAAENAEQPLIVDTHQHLWDRSKLTLPWLEDAPDVLRKSYLPADYRTATKGLNIRAVYMEVDVADGQHDKEAEHIIELVSGGESQTIGSVIGGRPDAPGFGDYIARHGESGVVQGVRQVLHGGSTPRGHCLRPEFIAGVRKLGERGMSFDLCMRPDELDDGRKLTEEAPDVTFIVDHCGNADPNAFHPGTEEPTHSVDGWKRSIEGLAKRPNTICKISGVIARVRPGWTAETLAPCVNFCLDAFGPDRVVFGSDWPVCLLGAPLLAWVQALRDIIAERPEPEQTQLWSGNALRIYRLNLA
ncbi:MAG: amidohydrolase family protein [Planctomyces sp.]|nr:amidohydrolase family protein [Planctomyces sp.]